MPYFQDEELNETPLSELILFDSNTPEDELAAAILQQEFDRALSELPENQRTVYELHVLGGIPFAEISEATGIGVSTLISRKRYAQETLREKLKNFL